jgi:iron complex outermembrane receptor protein
MSSRFKGRYIHKVTPGLAALLAVGGAYAQTESTPQDLSVEEIVVTGTRIVRDGVTAPTPVTVVSEARLENLGATNIGQVLNSLPAFRATSSPQTSNIQPRNAGMIQADLRGLGPNRTLVLVNGRRFTPSTQEGTVDLNQIPTLLIDRTEVVTGGASAAYGSDAVAGVVNLILKNDLEGVRTQVQYGETEEGDNETLNVAVAAGTSFAGGRGHVSVALEYEDNKGTGDCYTRDWCAREYQVVANSGATAVPGYPANNILPQARTVNAVQNGLILSGPAAGTTFNADGTPRPFQYGMLFGNPTFMVGGEGYNGFIGAPLMVIPVERTNVFLQGSFDFTDNLTGRLEASYGDMEANGRGAQTRDFFPAGANAITIRGDNAYLPQSVRDTLTAAGQPLTSATSFVFGRMGDDFGYTRNVTTTEVYRVMAGLEGKFGDSWSWDAYYQYGETDYEQTIYNNRIQQQTPGVPLGAGTCSPANPDACSRIQLASDAVLDPVTNEIVCRVKLTNPNSDCVPVNLFGWNQYSQAAYNYLYGTGFLTNSLKQHVAAASLQGDLFELPAGAVPLAVGVEYRENRVGTTADPISATSGFYVFNSTIVNGKIEVKEAFAETVIPVVRDITGVRSFELNGAVRVTDYNTSGDVTTWKLGAVYEPTDWLRFRATRSKDIRAPNTDELFRPQSSGFVTVGGVLTTQITGGNPDLVPEEADTWTVGVGFTGMGWAQGLRASIDFYQIDIQDAIATLTAQTLVNRCRDFGTYCDKITLATPGDFSSVSQVRVLFENLNQVEVKGIDFEINYNLPTSVGTWDFNLLATYLDELKTTDITGLAIDRAGVTGNNVSGGGAGLPEWQVNALVSYKVGNLTLTAEGRYIDSGLFDSTLIGPHQAGYDVTLPNSINDNTVASVFYLNMGARYAFELANDRKLEVFGGIRNVLDKDPPVAPSNQGSSNLILFDPLGRAFQLGLRMDF